MSFKEIRLLILWHFQFFVIGTGLFILLFYTPLFENITVFFYRGIVLLMLSCFMLALVFLFIIKKQHRKILNYRDLIISIVLIFCINLVFFTHVPVTADRSISVFLLGYMDNHSERKFSENEITEVFVDKYVYKNNSISKRLYEQIVTGNILSQRDEYGITKQGKFIMRIYKFIAEVFDIDDNNFSP